MQAAAKATLSNLVEEHLIGLVREASCVQRHSKRARFVHPRNVDSSSSSSTSRRCVQLCVEDINLALEWRGCERVYISESQQQGTSTTTVDLNAYVQSEMSLRPPSEIGVTAHWLAVDGVQPDIPQNPSRLIVARHHRSHVPGAAASRVVHRIEDDDDDDDEDDDALAATATTAETSAAGALKNATNTSDSSSTAATTAATTETASASAVSVRQLLPRLLSEELRLYFTRVTLAIERGAPNQQDAALVGIATDSGTQELVPFFSRFVARQMYDNLGHAEYCRALVRLSDALISNPYLHLELHLHQMLPGIITCVVANQLSSHPMDNHWSLREEAARTLVKACNKFGDQYTTLKARVIHTLCEALSPDKTLPTQYGGIVGIAMFGPKAVDAFLLPLAKTYWEQWEVALTMDDVNNDRVRRFQIQQCQHALLNALGVFMRDVSGYEQSQRVDGESLVDVFGEKLIPLQCNSQSAPMDYSSSII